MNLSKNYDTFFVVMKMQMNRLFEIVYMLLAHQSVTAKELAEHFEVSTRTIYRDIEALSGAGIPVYMCQGKGGGIRLMDNYILNKTVLSEEEQRDIISALQGIGAATGEKSDNLLDKLSGMFQREHESWIEVDFSDWSGMEQEKFNRIKEGILTQRTLEFEYYGRNSEKSTRRVNPLKLYFRDKTWYLNGYCLKRGAMRLFKLRRMKRVEITEETFDRTEAKYCELMADSQTKASTDEVVKIVLHIDESQAYRVYDEFLEDEIEVQEDHSFLVTVGFPEDEWVYGMILSYGSHLKVIEPIRVKNLVEAEIKRALTQYQS